MPTLRSPACRPARSESFASPRCTGPDASAASPSAPSETTTISPRSAPRRTSVAKRSARGKSARASVAAIASSSRSSAEVSPVIGPSGVTIASICAMSIRSAPPSPRIIFFTSSLATPRRLGATSVACIDALASTRTTTLRPLMRLSAARGSPRARTRSARSASCRSSERRRLSFEKRLVASLSRRIRSQSGENGTATTRRRSLST